MKDIWDWPCVVGDEVVVSCKFMMEGNQVGGLWNREVTLGFTGLCYLMLQVDITG